MRRKTGGAQTAVGFKEFGFAFYQETGSGILKIVQQVEQAGAASPVLDELPRPVDQRAPLAREEHHRARALPREAAQRGSE